MLSLVRLTSGERAVRKRRVFLLTALPLMTSRLVTRLRLLTHTMAPPPLTDKARPTSLRRAPQQPTAEHPLTGQPPAQTGWRIRCSQERLVSIAAHVLAFFRPPPHRVVYMLLTGEPPFDGQGDEIYAKIAKVPPILPPTPLPPSPIPSSRSCQAPPPPLFSLTHVNVKGEALR